VVIDLPLTLLKKPMEPQDTEHNEIEHQRLTKDLRLNMNLILNEHQQLAEKINIEDLLPLINAIQQSKRIFLVAAGRSGFAMRAAAMRLMHLGLTAFFVGDTTTPAITKGDLLIAASGSGTTTSIVRAGEKAKSVGAKVIALTTATTSGLAEIADHTVFIPAAGKQEFEGSKSKQYAGSLFEQFIFILMDVVFQSLWKMDGTPAEELWKRHANLE
jgi:6-phospho-3-hexuloisomerase